MTQKRRKMVRESSFQQQQQQQGEEEQEDTTVVGVENVLSCSFHDAVDYDHDGGDDDDDDHNYFWAVDEVTTTTSTTTRAKTSTEPPLPGILRNSRFASSKRNRSSSLSYYSSQPDLFPIQAIWKCFVLLLIPMIGYVLSQLYPSSMLLHFIFLCFVYGMVDLMEHDPSFSITAPILLPPPNHKRKRPTMNANNTNNTNTYEDGQTTTATTSLSSIVQQEELSRRRRVAFAEGTKFYRLPKPLSRKQQQALREQRFQQSFRIGRSSSSKAHKDDTSEDAAPTMTAHKDDPTNSTRLPVPPIHHRMPPTFSYASTTMMNAEPKQQHSDNCSNMPPPRTTLPATATTTSTTLDDWEATNRLLKSIINQNKRRPLLQQPEQQGCHREFPNTKQPSEEAQVVQVLQMMVVDKTTRPTTSSNNMFVADDDDDHVPDGSEAALENVEPIVTTSNPANASAQSHYSFSSSSTSSSSSSSSSSKLLSYNDMTTLARLRMATINNNKQPLQESNNR